MQRIHVIDSHTGGEPTRVVLDGFPEFDPGLSLAAKRDALRLQHDAYRAAVAREPATCWSAPGSARPSSRARWPR